MVINPDGGVSPCCVVYRKNRDFADLVPDQSWDVHSIWNNPKYRSARSLYSAAVLADKSATVCDGCDIFTRHPSKTLPVIRQASNLVTIK
jgi:hypothetical protein